MLVGFEDAEIHLAKLAKDKPFANAKLLSDWVQAHYKQEVIRQSYKIIGSINFLGNPVGKVPAGTHTVASPRSDPG